MRDFESAEDEFRFLMSCDRFEEAIVFAARAIYNNIPNVGMYQMTEAVRQYERFLRRKEIDEARAILESRRRSEG